MDVTLWMMRVFAYGYALGKLNQGTKLKQRIRRQRVPNFMRNSIEAAQENFAIATNYRLRPGQHWTSSL
jgi:hypothetical protein